MLIRYYCVLLSMKLGCTLSIIPSIIDTIVPFLVTIVS